MIFEGDYGWKLKTVACWDFWDLWVMGFDDKFLIKMKKLPVIALPVTAIVLLGLFSNCKKDCGCHRQPDNDYMVFGQFYGMCMGETCVEIFKMENGNLYEDTTDQYPFGSSPYNGSYIQLPQAKYNLVEDLANYVPPQLLNEGDTIIGMPDAYDQGGYYVELKESGGRRYWLIDTDKDNIPAYLRAFTDTLNNYIDRIAD